jgi:hypothetical protein
MPVVHQNGIDGAVTYSGSLGLRNIAIKERERAIVILVGSSCPNRGVIQL